ncbi:cyclin-dependent kinase inhibitor 3 isoform X4 [Pogoniulus pusillus]|uniref:cyclin-dependent kinase inhibitor 3 isoform X4 n=1 Tax=Pogoniulus pusillus TaxID=488313 RepID=UPI0030B91FD6
MARAGGGRSNGRRPGSSAMVKPPCAMQAGGCDSSDEDTAEEDPTPLNISWLSLSPVYSSEFLGISSLPGCRFKDIRRNLQKDIDAYQQQELCVHHYPIPDGDVPDIATCCRILEELRSCLESNRKTVIHCFGGLGRSCLIAACLLLQLSDTLAPQQVIDNLRSLRGSGAIQTIKQYNYLHDFREKLAAHLATKGTALRSVSR